MIYLQGAIKADRAKAIEMKLNRNGNGNMYSEIYVCFLCNSLYDATCFFFQPIWLAIELHGVYVICETTSYCSSLKKPIVAIF